MVGKSLSAALLGIDARLITIEVDLLPSQLPGFTIVGLPDKAVQEARERIVSSIKNAGFEWPRKKVIVNLAPADIPKTGSAFDLPIALAILSSSGQVEFDYKDYIIAGELSLEGNTRPMSGALSIAMEAKRLNIRKFILPYENAFEAGLVDGVESIGVMSFGEVVEYLNKKRVIQPTKSDWKALFDSESYSIDFKDIQGQAMVKRAAEIAASGGHNLLLSGTPGSGKTLISKALPSILPQLTFEEALEITKIYSVANLLQERGGIVSVRPFRSPHHTASAISIIGGGKVARPGELSLAHRGILFLDEFPEFSTYTLEALRQPLEDRRVIVSRVSGTLAFPANFILVAAMNPCKCGWKGDPERECTCTPYQSELYKKRISGPILDRIDLQITVPRVKIQDLANTHSETHEESSAQIRERVQTSRNLQLERYKNDNYFCNSEVPQRDIEKYCPLSDEAKHLLLNAAQKFNLSARSYFRIIKVSRTIADLASCDIIGKSHIAEALQYRITE